MRCSVFIAVVALGLTCVVAQKISGGGCPDVTVKSDFDVSKYTGLWYEFEKNPTPFEFALKCNTATYEDKGDYVSVLNKGISIITGKEQTIQGKATIPDPAVPAKLEVQFDNPFKGQYWVLDTDYENYSVVYSCSSLFKLFKTEFVWILSRKPALDDENRDKAYKVLEDNKISKDGLERSVQDCA